MNRNTRAYNWKEKQINEVIKTKNQMIELKIEPKLIEQYMASEYSSINKEYQDKINKAKIRNLETVNNNKKKLEIDFLIKNKLVLEEKGYDKDYIEQYVEQQYDYINNKYANINFID